MKYLTQEEMVEEVVGELSSNYESYCIIGDVVYFNGDDEKNYFYDKEADAIIELTSEKAKISDELQDIIYKLDKDLKLEENWVDLYNRLIKYEGITGEEKDEILCLEFEPRKWVTIKDVSSYTLMNKIREAKDNIKSKEVVVKVLENLLSAAKQSHINEVGAEYNTEFYTSRCDVKDYYETFVLGEEYEEIDGNEEVTIYKHIDDTDDYDADEYRN